MARSTQLRIVWDGPIESLLQHRVSLSAFGEPLSLLLAAAKRIASNMLSDALEPAKVGRLAKEAHQVDIEIDSVVGGSGGVATVMTFQADNAQQPLFNDLTENVGIALLDAIDAERQGILKNISVRNYLQSLPTLLTRQVYELHENGRSIKRIEFGSMRLPELPTELPYVVEIIGRVIGVGFEPGRPEVRLKSEEEQIIVPATSEQVDKALEFRSTKVRALILKHGSFRTRLLKIEDDSLPRFRGDRETYVFKRWDGLLRRLAQ